MTIPPPRKLRSRVDRKELEEKRVEDPRDDATIRKVETGNRRDRWMTGR
jgi:hypothetical protein